jgi:hypothetical protein
MPFSRFFKSPFFIILAVAIFSFWPVSFFVYTFKWDMLDVVFPFRYFAGECIQNGIFPLWNPYQLTGSPVFADMQYPLWSPEVWLVGLTTGYNIYILHILFIFYLFLAGYGMYRLTFHFSGHRLTSLVTGISYMLCGFFVGHGQALFSIIGASFLPWVVLYMVKNLSEPSLYRTLKLALFIFLQLATGYQAISIITGYLIFCIFLVYLFDNLKDRNRLFSIIKFNGLLFLVVLLLCLVILIPVIQVSEFNNRLGSGLTYNQAKILPFTINCLISLVTPFATVKNPEFFGTDISMRNMHFGLIMLLIFVVTLFRKKTGLQWVMLLFGFICFLASFGDGLPVHKFLYQHVPLFNRFRMPAYFTLFTIFSILLITGIHLSNLLNQINSHRKSLISLFTISLSLLIIMFGFCILRINFGESVLRKILHQPYLIPEGLTFYENLSIQSVFQGFLLTLAIITLVNKKLLKHFSTVLPVLVIIEMAAAVNLNIYYTVISSTKPAELNNYMVSQPKGFPLPDNTPIIENSDKNLTHSPLYRNMGILTKRISYDGFSSFILNPYNYLYDSLPRLKDSLLNNPIVYLSGRVQKIAFLKDPGISFSRKDLYVPDSVFSILPAGLKKDLRGNRVNILSFSPVKLKVRYSSDSSSIITFMQADHPGWQVKIDGYEVHHFKSNYLYLSAVAPSGNHEVVFEFRNRVVAKCFIISYSVLTLLIILLFYLHYRNSSALKARLFPLLVIGVVLITSLGFFSHHNTGRKKEKIYKIFADSLTEWQKEFSHDSFYGLFNLDDTIKFNHLLNHKNNIELKYFRFNEMSDLGEFYRYVLALNSRHFVYGYSNLYNPPETEIIIRESFPVMVEKIASAWGGLSLYSRSGNGKPAKVVYSSKNDYESTSPGWKGNSAGYDESVFSTGKYSERMDSSHIYSSTFRERINDITKRKDLYLIITADVFLTGNSHPLLVYEEKNGEQSKKWNSLDVRKFVNHSNQWEKVFFMVRTGKNHANNDYAGIFFWNIDKSIFYVDNFKVEGYLSNSFCSKSD